MGKRGLKKRAEGLRLQILNHEKKMLSDLLDEYEEECLNAVRLIEGLKLRTLTEEQIEDMLGELSASDSLSLKELPLVL